MYTGSRWPLPEAYGKQNHDSKKDAGESDWVVARQRQRRGVDFFAVSWFIRRGHAEAPSNGALVLSLLPSYSH
jgi:hypothetical protein